MTACAKCLQPNKRPALWQVEARTPSKTRPCRSLTLGSCGEHLSVICAAVLAEIRPLSGGTIKVRAL